MSSLSLFIRPQDLRFLSRHYAEFRSAARRLSAAFSENVNTRRSRFVVL